MYKGRSKSLAYLYFQVNNLIISVPTTSNMISTTSFFVALTAVVGSLAAPSAETPATLTKRQVDPGEGYHDDYFYSHWTDGGGSIQYYNQEGGGYTVDWQDTGNFVSGKGWNPGTNDR